MTRLIYRDQTTGKIINDRGLDSDSDNKKKITPHFFLNIPLRNTYPNMNIIKGYRFRSHRFRPKFIRNFYLYY